MKVNRAGDGWNDGDEDLEVHSDPGRKRFVTIEGRDWILESKDPYGLIYVRTPNGPTPEELNVAFTAFPIAEAAVTQYMFHNPVSPAKREAKEQGTTPPVLKRKKVQRPAEASP